MSDVFRWIAHNGSAGQSFATVMGMSPAGVFVASTDSDASPLGAGTQFSFGTTYGANQTFLSFDTSALGATPGLATLTLTCSFAGSDPITLVVAAYDWGATIDSADWRTTAQLSGLPEAGRITIASPGPGDIYTIDIDPTLLVVGGNTRFVVFDEHESTGTAPTGDNNMYLDGPLDASPPDLTWGAGGATIDSRSPTSGPTAGGTPVTLTGSGFLAATDVTVDGASVGFTIVDDSTITFTTDAHAAGSVAVVVHVPGLDGSTTFTFADVTPPPPVEDDCLALQVGGFLADGSTPDGDGIVYTVSEISGWFDGAPIRFATTPAQPSGEVPTVFRENGRQISLTIVAHAPSGTLGEVGCFTAIQTVVAAFEAIYVPVSLRIADAVNDTTRLVRLAAPIRPSIIGKATAVSIQIPLLAPDPT